MHDAVNWRRWYAVYVPILLIATAILIAAPDVDLRVSAWAGSARDGFPLADSMPIGIARGVILLCALGFVLALIGSVLLHLIRAPWRPIPLRDALFVLACMAIGPGLAVNGLLKHISGRVRPFKTDVFGGSLPFQPVFDFSGPCRAACSFVSAETAFVATAMMCLVLMIRPKTGQGGRWPQVWAASLFVATIAAIRIAFGAHFPSDVIYSVLLVAGLVPAIHIAFGLGRLTT